MQNILDTFSQATLLINNLFIPNNASTAPSAAAISFLNITSFGPLGTSGLLDPSFIHSAGAKAVCLTGTLALPVSTTTIPIPYPGPNNTYQLTEFLADLFRLNSDAFMRYTSAAPTPFQDTFDIFVKLCMPATASDPSASGVQGDFKSVQFLTHGGIGDASYWDFAPGYSYIDHAASRGHITFTYDRVGCGRSSHPDPIQTVQAPLQVDVAHALIQLLRAGAIGGMPFARVFGVGHSLGAAVTQSVSQRYTADFDAVMLTGHSGHRGGAGIGFASTSRVLARELGDEQVEWKDLPGGYIVLGRGTQTLQFAFFAYPYFEERILHALHTRRGTSALGETLTLAGIYTPAPGFAKPVLVLNGQRDLFYCQGDCLADGADITAQALAMYYPNAPPDKSRAVTLPDMGHHINMHLGCGEAFERMVEWVEEVMG